MMKKMIYKCGSELGLACLSTFPNNPALWERCSGMGNGLCIEIEVPGDLINKTCSAATPYRKGHFILAQYLSRLYPIKLRLVSIGTRY
jgi:hypothetical protein